MQVLPRILPLKSLSFYCALYAGATNLSDSACSFGTLWTAWLALGKYVILFAGALSCLYDNAPMQPYTSISQQSSRNRSEAEHKQAHPRQGIQIKLTCEAWRACSPSFKRLAPNLKLPSLSA